MDRLLPAGLQLGTEPTTRAYSDQKSRNRTSNLSVHGTTPKQLSHTGQSLVLGFNEQRNYRLLKDNVGAVVVIRVRFNFSLSCEFTTTHLKIPKTIREATIKERDLMFVKDLCAH